MKRKFCTLLTFSLLLAACAVSAQSNLYKMTGLPLNDLSAFQSPGKNWQVVGEVSGSFNDMEFKTKAGKGILLNTLPEKEPKYQAAQNLFTTFEHGDVAIELDFMLPKGSNSGIYLQSRYEIQLFDSWGVKTLKNTDCGSIYERWDESKPEGQKSYQGHPARTNASFAPGLWQHLSIEFQAPRFDASGKKMQLAKFVKVMLNGITIHENVILSGPTRGAAFNDEKAKASLMIQGDHGTVAFRNIRYAFLDDFKFEISPVNYVYYEGDDFEKIAQVKPAEQVKKGTASSIDSRLADARDEFYLTFSGKLQAATADTYTFFVPVSGVAKLEIDGQPVVPEGQASINDKPLQGSTQLSAGEHSFTLHYLKHISWMAPGVGLLVQKTNSKPKPLHALPSLPEPEPVPLIDVQAQAEPQILRSYLMHQGKKKTHVLSVGNPSGVHFSYDLNQAGVLQIWKSDFLNTTDMWHERGEPQTAASMGAGITLPGVCPVTIYTDQSRMFPDSLDDETELVYKGYALDGQRQPTFTYQYQDSQFTDRLSPYENGKGLTRQIKISNPPAGKQLAYRLAEGKNITEVSKNVFRVDTGDTGFYVQLPDNKLLKPTIQEKSGSKVLTLPYQSGKNAINEVTCELIW